MAALVSAFPSLAPVTVWLCLGILVVVTMLNLRGLGDAARAFFLPTAVFVLGLLAVIAIGLAHPLDPHARSHGVSLIAAHPLATVSVLLILKAFSSGCSALTGVEAIANGVPTFREPRVVHAKRTELLLGVILGVMLLGLAILAERFHVGPRTDNTVLNQIMIFAVGHGPFYYIVAFAIVIELALAANTSFGGLPLLASLLARDNLMPHLFGLRSERMVLARGIIVLAVPSALLLVGVNGNTNTLIPMFAIGVFTGFTLAQTGMVVHWRRLRPTGWRRRALLNGLGATLSALATVIFVLTKFTEGAWIVVVVVPLIILLFVRVRTYYGRVEATLALGPPSAIPSHLSVLAVIPITAVSLLTENALAMARELAPRRVAVRVLLPGEHELAPTMASSWSARYPDIDLHLIPTEYQSVTRPLQNT